MLAESEGCLAAEVAWRPIYIVDAWCIVGCVGTVAAIHETLSRSSESDLLFVACSVGL